jgi:GAF domain-containing protein
LTTLQGDLGTNLASVYIKDQTRDQLIMTDALGAFADELIGQVVPLGTRVSGWVGANGRAIINTDARLEFPSWARLEPECTCAVLPIRTSSQVVGVLLVVRSGKRQFDPTEVGFLEKVCNKFDEAPLSDLLGHAGTVARFQGSSKRPSVH